MYTEEKLAAIAARDNNTKRKYLVVNRLQGKHIPVKPSDFFGMTDALANIVREAYKGEKLLLIGFAETATAIGMAVASKLDTLYMQTTRENIEGVEWLYFTESHSHATEQKLVRNSLDEVILEIDRIVFIEDEVTTGNTILKIVDIIDREYGGKVKFSVASLLNGMDEQSRDNYRERNIGIHYLVKTDHSGYTEIAEKYCNDGDYFSHNSGKTENPTDVKCISGGLNSRKLVSSGDYTKACGNLYDSVKSLIDRENGENLLVLGTEECMFPALYIAAQFENAGYNVRCHSTTRSPITVSREEKYPLHRRYELLSLYDDERITFIYDLKKYDSVLIITDSPCKSDKGVNCLVNALESCGNENIHVIKWENEDEGYCR